MLKKIPDALCVFRLITVPFLVHLALLDRHGAFLVLLAASLLSDSVDGIIARRLNVHSRLGAQLDTWADLAVYAALPPCAWKLWPEIILREFPFVMAVIVSFVLPVVAGTIKYRRPPSYHTLGIKISAVLMGISTLLLLTGVTPWPFRIATPALVLAQVEELAMIFVVPHWHPDIASLRAALRVRREMLAADAGSPPRGPAAGWRRIGGAPPPGPDAQGP